MFKNCTNIWARRLGVWCALAGGLSRVYARNSRRCRASCAGDRGTPGRVTTHSSNPGIFTSLHAPSFCADNMCWNKSWATCKWSESHLTCSHLSFPQVTMSWSTQARLGSRRHTSSGGGLSPTCTRHDISLYNQLTLVVPPRWKIRDVAYSRLG